MTKKIVIAFGIISVAALVYLFFGKQFRPSPPGRAELTNGDLSVTISYSRPSVKGRTIFGTAEEGALQPYGKYWRLGANEATEINFNKDVIFNGKPVKAGTYSMYAVPGAETFDIALNSETDKSGASEPNHSLDVLHTLTPVQPTDSPVETFTISLEPMDSGITIIFEWASTRFIIPVTN
ncbi:MAG TPA: DUF2911 domain-containing protein [Cyclobacteriaceae bacterium]|nr:DUF2911 domain-containing protein [Cyclobacteriaceae bacterium]